MTLSCDLFLPPNPWPPIGLTHLAIRSLSSTAPSTASPEVTTVALAMWCRQIGSPRSSIGWMPRLVPLVLVLRAVVVAGSTAGCGWSDLQTRWALLNGCSPGKAQNDVIALCAFVCKSLVWGIGVLSCRVKWTHFLITLTSLLSVVCLHDMRRRTF